MRHLTDVSDIWVLTPTKDDLDAGARYAAMTVPWTFNRMMLNTTSNSMQSRALNIAKGIVGQEMLIRAVNDRGGNADAQRKSHRDDDLFDLKMTIGGRSTKIDLKTVNYYSNYAPVGRLPFSAELVAQYAGYPGPDWRTFFPMLVPHTQILQGKEAYCFAIAESVDVRRDTHTGRSAYAFTALPYGAFNVFLCSRRLCEARESAGEGFWISIEYETRSMFEARPRILVLGECDGDPVRRTVSLKPGKPSAVGPFSMVSSLQVSRSFFEKMGGRFRIRVGQNSFGAPVFDYRRRDINVAPEGTLDLARGDFCNLHLPTDYRLFVIGWTTKRQFIDACRGYSGWVWPSNADDKFANQAWSLVTDKDRKALSRAGFGAAVGSGGVEAGWLKTHGRGGGACCYVFPNIGRNGGVKETNLYVLPQDLYDMDSLVEHSG